MDGFDRLPPDAISIAFLQTGRSDTLPDGWIHEKLAPATIVAVARRGQYEVHSAKRRTLAGEGEAFLSQDKQPLRIVHHGRRRGEEMRAHWLHARFTLFHTVDVIALLDLPPKLGVESTRPFIEIISELSAIENRAGSASSIASYSRTIELGFRALSLLTACAPIGATGSVFLQHVHRLAPVLKFIHEHLRDPLDVDDLAQAARMSRSRFFAFFREHMRRAPMEYLKEVRLDEARKRLLASDDKLSAIAEETGFANPFHLSRELKRHLGITPAAFRKMHRGFEV
jgi:AraC-like DNA-binding protein